MLLEGPSDQGAHGFRTQGASCFCPGRGLHLLGWHLPGAPGLPREAPFLTTITQRHWERALCSGWGQSPPIPSSDHRTSAWALGPGPACARPAVRPDRLGAFLSSLHGTEHRTTHSTSLPSPPPPATEPKPVIFRRTPHGGAAGDRADGRTDGRTGDAEDSAGIWPGHPLLQDSHAQPSSPCQARRVRARKRQSSASGREKGRRTWRLAPPDAPLGRAGLAWLLPVL